MQTVDAEELARLFRYFSQENNPRVAFRRELKNIPVKTFYAKHRKHFDKLAAILSKYSIDPRGFVELCVIRYRVFHPKDMLSTDMFRRYADSLQKKEQYRKIYSAYMKTVDFIVSRCIELEQTPKRYLTDIVMQNRLAYEYVAGRISKYFIATMPCFKDFYMKMDSLNRDELCIIFNAKDELEAMVQDSFLFCTGESARPLKLVEEQLKRKLITKINATKREKQTCAHSAQTSS